MADRWLNEYLEIELNKPQTLRGLLEKGFTLYGYQDHNEVYQLKDEILLYNPMHDEVICSWSLEALMDGLENE